MLRVLCCLKGKKTPILHPPSFYMGVAVSMWGSLIQGGGVGDTIQDQLYRLQLLLSFLV